MTDFTGSFTFGVTAGLETAGSKTTFSSFVLTQNVVFQFVGFTNALTLTPDTPGTLALSVDTPGTLNL